MGSRTDGRRSKNTPSFIHLRENNPVVNIIQNFVSRFTEKCWDQQERLELSFSEPSSVPGSYIRVEPSTRRQGQERRTGGVSLEPGRGLVGELGSKYRGSYYSLSIFRTSRSNKITEIKLLKKFYDFKLNTIFDYFYMFSSSKK